VARHAQRAIHVHDGMVVDRRVAGDGFEGAPMP
jgi:hypothetical protein